MKKKQITILTILIGVLFLANPLLALAQCPSAKKAEDGCKCSAKKDLIMKEDEIEVLGVDIKALLWKEKIDVAAVGTLIDQKYEAKKAKIKMLVKALADLKGTLKEGQMTKLKKLYKAKKKAPQISSVH